jgi:hypothetical protein
VSNIQKFRAGEYKKYKPAPSPEFIICDILKIVGSGEEIVLSQKIE